MGFADGVNARVNRDRLRQRATERNQDLQKAGYSFEDGEMKGIREGSSAHQAELMAKEAVMRSKALFGKMAKFETANAMEEYALTGDADILDRDLNSSPEKKASWVERGVSMVGNIDFARDGDLLNKLGFSATSYDTEEKQEIIRRGAYKIHNGKNWTIGLANQAMAETGVGKTLGKRRSKPIKDNHKKLVELLSGPKSNAWTADGHKYQTEIEKASKETGVPANLLASMMETESNGNPNAVSTVRGKDYTGLMQVGEAAAKDVGIEDRNASADANITAGARYLKLQLDKYGGDVKLALAAYNAGGVAVDKYGGIPPYSETQNYVKKITGRLDEAESYYRGSAEEIYSAMLTPKQATESAEPKDAYEAFLQIDREQASAKAGKTASQVSRSTEAGIENTVATTANTLKNTSVIDRKLNQEDRTLDINQAKIVNKSRELAQELTKPTNKRKQLTEADAEELKIYDTFGGYDEFMGADIKVGTKQYTDAFNSMVITENLRDMKPSDAQLKKIGDVRLMATLMKGASKITPEQTGMVDSSLKTVKEYLDDTMTDGEASAMFHAARNVYIHAFAGSTQSKGEIARTVKAFGSDNLAFGSAITKMGAVMTGEIAKIDSLMRNMSPISAKLRLGTDMASLQETKANLQETIDYIEANKKFSEIGGVANDPTNMKKFSKYPDNKYYVAPKGRLPLGDLDDGK